MDDTIMKIVHLARSGDFKIEAPITCPKCKETGKYDKKHGYGYFSYVSTVTCPRCNGHGTVPIYSLKIT